MMPTIHRTALDLLAASRRIALATVIHTVGSAPQKAGAAAVFEADGTVHGTLGGGCLEAEARQRALRALDEGIATAFDLKLDEVDGWDDGLVCGGRVRIFVDPDPARNVVAFAALEQARRERQPGVLVTVIRHSHYSSGMAMWMHEAELLQGEGPFETEPLLAFLAEDAPGLMRRTTSGQGEFEVFVQPVLPRPRLIIAGAGHIGKALSHLGRLLDFDVTVVDDRPIFANAAFLPDAHRVLCGDIAAELAALSPDERSYVVIVTRGHQHDGQALAACIHAPVPYLGLIGSRRKSLLLRRRLLDEGLASEEEVARVVSPIGLDLGGRTVQEIALSIAAQLVTVRRKNATHTAPLAAPLLAERGLE